MAGRANLPCWKCGAKYEREIGVWVRHERLAVVGPEVLGRICRESFARRGLAGGSSASSRSARALWKASSVVRHVGGRGLFHVVWFSRISAGGAVARTARPDDVAS